MKSNFLSRIALLICCLVILYEGVIFYPKWNKSGTEATISWDVSSYYIYLPAVFIYKDLKHCSFKDDMLSKYGPTPEFLQGFLHPSGNYIFKCTCGQALMFSPFFFLGHLYAKLSHQYPADGYSLPYQISIGIAALFYSLLGLWLLRKLLLQYFADGIVAITLLAIVLASNYLNYAAIDGALTHNTLFALYAALILVTISFYKKPSIVRALLIGGICGLATLTRPTEIISAIIPLLWGAASIPLFKKRLLFFIHNLKYVIALGLAFAMVVSAQLMYWKYVSGQWYVYSYQDQGFSWLRPHLWDGIFSYKTGWLIYSPVMIFAIIGFVPLFKKMRGNFLPIIIFSLLFIYIAFAWDCWWYGGSLGQRCMVQAYVVLSFPMAAFFELVYQKRKFLILFVTPLLLLFSYYNLWLIYQAHGGGLYHAGEMTGQYLKAVLFRYHVDENTIKLLDDNKIFEGNPKNYSVIYTNNLDSENFSDTTSQNAISGKSIFLDGGHLLSREYQFKIPEPHVGWIRVSADFRITSKEWDIWKMPQMIVRFYNNGSEVKSHGIRINRIINENETRNVWMDIKLSDNPKFDKAILSFWNPSSEKKIIIDNLKVIVFND